jgi:hypothetical protein
MVADALQTSIMQNRQVLVFLFSTSENRKLLRMLPGFRKMHSTALPLAGKTPVICVSFNADQDACCYAAGRPEALDMMENILIPGLDPIFPPIRLIENILTRGTDAKRYLQGGRSRDWDVCDEERLGVIWISDESCWAGAESALS